MTKNGVKRSRKHWVATPEPVRKTRSGALPPPLRCGGLGAPDLVFLTGFDNNLLVATGYPVHSLYIVPDIRWQQILTSPDTRYNKSYSYRIPGKNKKLLSPETRYNNQYVVLGSQENIILCVPVAHNHIFLATQDNMRIVYWFTGDSMDFILPDSRDSYYSYYNDGCRRCRLLAGERP